MLLDYAGLGPIKTPSRIVHEQAGVRLHAYQEARRGGRVVLLIPAPIKRAYIWDLAPRVSVVQRFLQQGMRVYLAEWLPIEGSCGGNFGLEDYADRLLSACLDAIESDTGQRGITLAAHSLGGTLVAIFSCLHPQRVRSVVLLQAPLCFAMTANNCLPLIGAAPAVESIARMARMFNDEQVPGSLLNLISTVAVPGELQGQRYLDLFACAGNPADLATHMRVERWMLDELPMPAKLFIEVIELLYRENRLMQNSLRMHGRLVSPADMTVPLLSVYDPHSAIAPPQSILPFHLATKAPLKEIMLYHGDIGVAIQHVGPLVGRNAHAHLWPAIFGWLGTVEQRSVRPG
jgi:polyhydroxyalkanoate synthase